MGVTGVDGVFKRCAQTVLRVMRQQQVIGGSRVGGSNDDKAGWWVEGWWVMQQHQIGEGRVVGGGMVGHAATTGQWEVVRSREDSIPH